MALSEKDRIERLRKLEEAGLLNAKRGKARQRKGASTLSSDEQFDRYSKPEFGEEASERRLMLDPYPR